MKIPDFKTFNFCSRFKKIFKKTLRVDIGLHEPTYFRWDGIEKKFRPQTYKEVEEAIFTLHKEHKFDLIEIDGLEFGANLIIERLRHQGINAKLKETGYDNSKRTDGN